ncbi:BLUF domain-containing protein [uncultured Sphingomonas sp.]|uniref:BLUF domain-containing protein n=1 Tax=uncultured Sphingomonas sp. TaxID=158754 RepID=UPI0025D180E6|nr:BLUF domain-containing protein [uncultured Sphingomonas sp.]
MLQLTYISTGTPGLSGEQIRDILRTSRANNFRAGLTGLLLYDGYRFLQALEGEPSAVMATYNRIKLDPRHRALVLLSQRTVEVRSFGGWAMAAQRVTIAAGETVADLVDRMTDTLEDKNMRELFRGFARVRQAA